MFKKILNFIYSKKDEGIYCYITILGIKITTKPLRLQIENKLNEIENNINKRFDELYPFMWERMGDIHQRFNDLYPFMSDRTSDINKRFDELYPFMWERMGDIHQRFNDLYPFISDRINDFNCSLDKITPKANLDFIEIHLVEHCNLNCQSCSHFSQLAKPSFLDINIFERDMKRLSEISNGQINKFHLMGGEPLLHPDCDKFFYINRKYFKESEIKLVTNGLLLLKKDDNFWKSLKDNNITLSPTKYPVNIDWNKIKEICIDKEIKLSFFNDESIEKTSFKNPLNLEGTENAEWNFRNCWLANNCLFLDNGKLYTCTLPPVIKHFNSFFGKNIPVTVNDYIDIYKINNYQEILQFMAKPIPFCKYCDVKNRRGDIPWKTSTKKIDEYIN